MLMRSVDMRQQRHWPLGFCPPDLKEVRRFYAPLQRHAIASLLAVWLIPIAMQTWVSFHNHGVAR